MFKLPQTQRIMKLVLILAGIALFISMIIGFMEPIIFIAALIGIIFTVGALALLFKIFEWICFGSDD